MAAPVIALRDDASVRALQQQLPHAVLLLGEAGLDTEAVADMITGTVSSDIRRVTPLANKTIITIEQIRDLTASLRTHATTRRMIIINPADAMTDQAQNALLKSLEEPNANTHFILVGATTGNILPTIQSRCQIVPLHRTSPHQDQAILEPYNLSPADTAQILFLAAGRPKLLRQLATTPRLLAAQQAIAADAKQLITAASPYEALRIAQSYATDRHAAQQLLSLILAIIRFQARRQPLSPQLRSLMERAIAAEQSLHANANLRLALAQLVLY
ncbi:MAG: hypothetical protein Q4A37_03175 [Candidatus Saccharibacteria bacterium]|nr:hypothetical protein [Candidatus Saccharibacteria bacterium]